MLFRIVRRSLFIRKKPMALMVASVAAGTAIAASLMSLSFDISERVSRELRSFGANITVQPRLTALADAAGQRRYLREEDIVKAKTIFWRHNIIGIMPVLTVDDQGAGTTLLGTWYKKTLAVPGEQRPFEAGVVSVTPWWKIDGRWPSADREVLAGLAYAKEHKLQINSRVTIRGSAFTVTGIVETGGKEDGMLIAELETLQGLSGLTGRVSRVLVSALTTPMDAFAYKDPQTMTRKEYEKWYCTGYVTSIAKQLEEVFAASSAKPVWPVAETEGRVRTRLKLLMYLLTAATLLASALGVSAAMVMSLLRRTEEVALMKTMGAGPLRITGMFLAEAAVIGITGGLAGYVLSLGVSHYIGLRVFGVLLEHKAFLLPMSVGAAVFISLAGAYLPVRRALGLRPAAALKGA